MSVAETVTRDIADHRFKRMLRSRLVQFVGVAALPASLVFAQAAKEPARDPSNPVETETGIPVKSNVVTEKCGTCHTADAKGNLSRISWVRTTPEGWAQVIKRMVALNGLSITPSESKAVVRALSASHGLAPEESKPVMYLTEHRMVNETNIPNETIPVSMRING